MVQRSTNAITVSHHRVGYVTGCVGFLHPVWVLVDPEFTGKVLRDTWKMSGWGNYLPEVRSDTRFQEETFCSQKVMNIGTYFCKSSKLVIRADRQGPVLTNKNVLYPLVLLNKLKRTCLGVINCDWVLFSQPHCFVTIHRISVTVHLMGITYLSCGDTRSRILTWILLEVCLSSKLHLNYMSEIQYPGIYYLYLLLSSHHGKISSAHLSLFVFLSSQFFVARHQIYIL